ncbi:MAG: CPBP family intramembrane metalloprotease [Anaerolineae bacterium]|nr:CPBP family intramembrane metalloprotease [Anaerolineae bacterium]
MEKNDKKCGWATVSLLVVLAFEPQLISAISPQPPKEGRCSLLTCLSAAATMGANTDPEQKRGLPVERMPESQEAPSTGRWGLREVLYAGLASLGLMLSAGLALLIVLGAWQMLGASAPPMELSALAILALELLMIPPAWFWGPRKYGGGWAALGFRGFQALRSVGPILATFVVMLGVNAGWDAVRQRLGWAGQPDILPLFGGGLAGLAVALLVGGVAAPVAEEVFFRGFVYDAMRRRWGVLPGIVVSGAVFALVHVIPGVLPPIFVLGMGFAYIYEKTDSLWPPIILHGAINSLAFVLAYVQELYPNLGAGF